MARAGLGSRRACEVTITQGRVQINGHTASLGMQADPEGDDIRVDGERLRSPEKQIYVMLNKPRGVISDEDVAGNAQRARDMIPIKGHLYPVGRLDLQSEGLMLFTNDGDLAHKLTHPRYEHSKTYRITVEGSPSKEVLDTWRRGVVLDEKRTAPAEVTRVGKTREGAVLHVTIREGRKRQLRRVAALLGHPVQRLQRIRLATLLLGDLPVGSWRVLTDEEVVALRRDVDRHPARRPRPQAPPDRSRTEAARRTRPTTEPNKRAGRRTRPTTRSNERAGRRRP